MKALTELRDISVFATLDEQALAEVARSIERRDYRPGDYIMFEGEQPPGLFFLRRGRVRLARTSPDGREQVLSMVQAGEHFSAVSLFDHHPNPTTARAMSPVECLLLPNEPLFALIRRHPDIALALLREMAGQLRELVVLVEDLAFRSVRERLARQLLREASHGTAQITQQELAERSGTVREIAGRALRQMAHDGLVELSRGQVIIIDRSGLANIAAGAANATKVADTPNG